MKNARVTRNDTFDRMPKRLSSQTQSAVERTWRAIQAGVRLSLRGMPPYAEALSETISDTPPHDVIVAMQRGDVPFFVAMLLRLDMLNDGLIRAGRSIADRAPIVQAKWVVEGFRLTAEKNLKPLKGHWPPTSDWGDDEPSEAQSSEAQSSAVSSIR